MEMPTLVRRGSSDPDHTNRGKPMQLYASNSQNCTAHLVDVYRLFFPLFLTGADGVADDEPPSPEASLNTDAMLLGVGRV